MTLIFSWVRFIDEIFFRIPFSSASHAHPSKEEIRSTKGSYSGVNIIARVAKPLKSRESHIFADICKPITHQTIELENCSNPLQIQKFFRFGFGVFWRWRHNEGMFWKFGRLWPALGPNPLTHSFDILLLKTRSKSTSIEPLIDLLAYL